MVMFIGIGASGSGSYSGFGFVDLTYDGLKDLALRTWILLNFRPTLAARPITPLRLMFPSLAAVNRALILDDMHFLSIASRSSVHALLCVELVNVPPPPSAYIPR